MPTVRHDCPALRLVANQQTNRYTSRGKMVANPWDPANLAKIPCEKPPVESGSSGSSDFSWTFFWLNFGQAACVWWRTCWAHCILAWHGRSSWISYPVPVANFHFPNHSKTRLSILFLKLVNAHGSCKTTSLVADGFLDADGPWQQCDSN